MYKIKLATILVFFHFGMVLLTNAIVEEQSIRDWFFNDKGNGTIFNLINKNKFIRIFFDIYGTYTGAETGFSFFAPNVSSSFLLTYSFKDKDNKIIQTRIAKTFSLDGKTRVFLIYDQFMDLLEQNQDTTRTKYLHTILKNIAYNELKMEFFKYKKVQVDLFLFDEQKMSEIREGKHQEFIPIKKLNYEF
jgi:hypothetical protein